jgi:hypothetical protein
MKLQKRKCATKGATADERRRERQRRRRRRRATATSSFSHWSGCCVGEEEEEEDQPSPHGILPPLSGYNKQEAPVTGATSNRKPPTTTTTGTGNRPALSTSGCMKWEKKNQLLPFGVSFLYQFWVSWKTIYFLYLAGGRGGFLFAPPFWVQPSSKLESERVTLTNL